MQYRVTVGTHVRRTTRVVDAEETYSLYRGGVFLGNWPARLFKVGDMVASLWLGRRVKQRIGRDLPVMQLVRVIEVVEV